MVLSEDLAFLSSWFLKLYTGLLFDLEMLLCSWCFCGYFIFWDGLSFARLFSTLGLNDPSQPADCLNCQPDGTVKFAFDVFIIIQ